MRAGTENVAGIAGSGVAAEVAGRALGEFAGLAALRDRLEREALAAQPRALIYGAAAPRLPNTSCIGLPGVLGETQVMALDLAGVAVSSGAACSSGKVRASHVLEAMGASQENAACAIRVSLGWSSRAADVDRFLECWGAIGRSRQAYAA
jgi:cysteine desulfurase